MATQTPLVSSSARLTAVPSLPVASAKKATSTPTVTPVVDAGARAGAPIATGANLETGLNLPSGDMGWIGELNLLYSSAQMTPDMVPLQLIPASLTELKKSQLKLQPSTGQHNSEFLPRSFANAQKLMPGLQKNYRLGLEALPTDPNALVQWVLRESYLETTLTLQDYAKKVQFFNETKKVLRGMMAKNREFLTNMKTAAANDGVDLEQLENGGTPATRQWIANYYAQNASAGTSALYTDMNGYNQSVGVGQMMENARRRSQEKYGVDMPESILNELEAAYTTGSDADKKKALRKVAMWFTYLGDGGVADGQWQKAPGGYDDINHVNGYGKNKGPDLSNPNSQAVQDDFEFYLLDPSNKTARSNLASGDIKIIEEAFGIQPGSLNGSSSMEEIIATAFLPVNDKWINDIIHGRDQSSVELTAELRKTGSLGDFAQQMWGDQAVEKWNELFGPDGEMSEIDILLRSKGLSKEVPPPGVTTPGEHQDYIDKLEEELSSVGDDAQLANVDLQNWLQKQQQTLQMMSNISKMLHDTAMAVIRKIGG